MKPFSCVMQIKVPFYYSERTNSPKVEQSPEKERIPHKGGGAFLFGGSPQFIDCRFDSNIVAYQSYYNYGGGVYCDNSSATFRNCVFTNNIADHGGDWKRLTLPIWSS